MPKQAVRVLLAWSVLLASVASAQHKSLVIGIDGLGYGEFGFSVAATPNMDSLITGDWQAGYRGAYSDIAFAGGILDEPATLQDTSSGPGWSTIHNGVWANKHGVTSNGNFANGDFEGHPSYLGILKSALPDFTTAAFINWTPIDSNIIQALADDGVPNNDVDHRSGGNDAAVATNAAAVIAGTLDPDAIFIQFDEVDGAGHSWGNVSPNYAAEISQTDQLVGQVLAAVGSRPNFENEDWQIVITSDHGHRPGGGHGGQTHLERTVPFIVASKSLNQGALSPLLQAVSLADVAPTVLDHFGVAIPSRYDGISRAGGATFVNPDINGDGVVSGDGSGTFANDDVTAFVSLWLQPNTAEDPNPADLNSDGVANISDWAILNEANSLFGASILAALKNRSVPEPTSGIMLLTMATGWVAGRKLVIVLRRPSRMAQ